MTRRQRFQAILDYFRTHMPIAESELVFDSPFQLLISTVLSAQCTDKRVNQSTPALFARWPDPAALSTATFEEVFPYVKSISYPNSKTRHIIALSQKIVTDFGGEIPADIDALMTLPGVGRKTANVFTSIVHSEPVIAVDTHVFRVSHRLGLSDGRTPRAVELDLEKHVPEELRPICHHWLILHGRYTCTARNPRCGDCGLAPFCRDRDGR